MHEDEDDKRYFYPVWAVVMVHLPVQPAAGRKGWAEAPLFVKVAPVEQQVVVDTMLARQPGGTDTWLHRLFNQRQFERQQEVGSAPPSFGF